MEFGSWPETYYVPWHLLRSTTWEEVPAGEHISLPFLSKAVGHTIVHYLYTGEYQTLSEIESIIQAPQSQFEHAFLVYMASLDHDLSGLEELAMLKMEKYSLSMDLKTVIDVTRNNLDKEMKPSAWLQAFLKERLRNDFQKDHTVFADEAFYSGLCQESILNGHVMRYMVELLTERLTQTLAEKDNIISQRDEPPVVEEKVTIDDSFSDSGGEYPKKKSQMEIKEEKEKALRERLEAVGFKQTGHTRLDSISSALAIADYISTRKMDEDMRALAMSNAITGSVPVQVNPFIIRESAPVEEPAAIVESAAAEEPEIDCQNSVPSTEPRTCAEVLTYALPPKPFCKDYVDESASETQGKQSQGPKPLKSFQPECYVPPPPPKKETATAKKKRLAQEKREKMIWERERQARMIQEAMEAFCAEVVPACDVKGGDPAPSVSSDSS